MSEPGFQFDPAGDACVITDPLRPRPWINYLGNRRLRAFVSHNAGGLLWFREPCSRRITRYHYTAPPGDRPGFYLYIRDRESGAVWNPHFAPTCTSLDSFACHHAPGRTRFEAKKDGVAVEVEYLIAPDDDVMLWRCRVVNERKTKAALQLTTYMEFGLLEFMREALGWCYLQNQFSLHYDAECKAIHYDYHVFEAPESPAILFGSDTSADGWTCSRDAFIGFTGTLADPEALRPGCDLRNDDLPLGGHSCAVLGHDLNLAPDQSAERIYVLALAADKPAASDLLTRFAKREAWEQALESVDALWRERLGVARITTRDDLLNRAVNTWIPTNALTALDLARTISTDHMGTDGLRFRDTMQDALAAVSTDSEFAAYRIEQVLAQQSRSGAGCMAFFPEERRPVTTDVDRSDNTVWPAFTIHQFVSETGDYEWLDKPVGFRDGGEDTVYGHLKLGLEYILGRCGPHGLPMLFHADWNDGLALFGDPDAESVMLGMQMVYALKLLGSLAKINNRPGDVQWSREQARALTDTLNSDAVWDGGWYRRLLLSNGKTLGSEGNAQGKIYLNPQSWSVLSGVGDYEGRGRMAMRAAAEYLDTDSGLRILAPPFRGIPEPGDPPLGSHPGVGENGGIFCHANTWAIMAECLLGNADRAWKYFRRILPEALCAHNGVSRYQREPYAFVSSVVGPDSSLFGEGGISWLTGTASWMQVAFWQYLVGLRPGLDGMEVVPCLPDALLPCTVKRRFRGRNFEISVDKDPVTGRWIPESLPVEDT